MTPRYRLRALCAAVLLAGTATARAHTVSNSYLNVNGDSKAANVFHGQWDISLRDLNFVLNLDNNGDGNITWGELKSHRQRIARYAYATLHFSDGDHACPIRPRKQMVDRHAASGYAALLFDVVCPAPPKALTVDNQLLFAIDPTHRGIFVFRDAGDAATALFSPANKTIKLDLPARKHG